MAASMHEGDGPLPPGADARYKVTNVVPQSRKEVHGPMKHNVSLGLVVAALSCLMNQSCTSSGVPNSQVETELSPLLQARCIQSTYGEDVFPPRPGPHRCANITGVRVVGHSLEGTEDTVLLSVAGVKTDRIECGDGMGGPLAECGGGKPLGPYIVECTLTYKRYGNVWRRAKDVIKCGDRDFHTLKG
jgi:hypothetical protein